MPAMRLLLAVCWIVCCASVGLTAEMPKNTVFDSLLNKGVLMPSGTSIKLPPPVMGETMSSQQQAAALSQMASGAHVTVADFVADTPYAQYYLKITTPHTDPTYRTIDVAFVARGKWAILISKDFGDKIMKGKKNNTDAGNEIVEKAGLLTKEEMAERKLTPSDDIDQTPILRKEGWLQTTLNLFGQVQVSATRHVMITKGPTSVLVAAMIDKRFDKDAKYANQWRSIIDLVKPVTERFGPPRPYQGTGFYVKAVQLAQPMDAIFFEYHSTYYEPQGWFDGANTLRAQLPKMIKFQTEKFRRQFAKESEAAQDSKPAANENSTK